jgi:hypothetical protein
MRRAASLAAWLLFAVPAAAADCRGTLYLTIDTGSMSQAELIARTLVKHDAR